MTDKVNYDVRELKLGASFTNNKASQYHTIKYDFKPASVDVNKMATVDVGTNNQVTVTVPHLDGAGVPQTVFKGNQRPYTKECVLIIDRVTGEITLEKLSSNIQVKKTRQECATKPRPHTPAAPPPITDTTQRSSSRTKVTTNKRTNNAGNTNNVIPNNSNGRPSVGMVRSPPRQRTEAPQAAPWTGGNSTLASLPMIGLDDSPAAGPPPPQTHNDFPRNAPNQEFSRSIPQQQPHEFPRSAPMPNHEFGRTNEFSRGQPAHEFPRAAPPVHNEFPRTAVAPHHNNMQQRQPDPSSVPRQTEDNSGSSSSSSSDSGSDSDSNSDDDNKSLPRDVLKDDLCLSSSDSD